MVTKQKCTVSRQILQMLHRCHLDGCGSFAYCLIPCLAIYLIVVLQNLIWWSLLVRAWFHNFHNIYLLGWGVYVVVAGGICSFPGRMVYQENAICSTYL